MKATDFSLKWIAAANAAICLPKPAPIPMLPDQGKYRVTSEPIFLAIRGTSDVPATHWAECDVIVVTSTCA
jgi:hypothetical protein